MTAKVLRPDFHSKNSTNSHNQKNPNHENKNLNKFSLATKINNANTSSIANPLLTNQNSSQSQNQSPNQINAKQIYRLQERRNDEEEIDNKTPNIEKIESHSHNLLQDVLSLATPWEWLCNPTFIGLKNIPEKGPVLFVSNHTIMAILDLICLWKKLSNEKGIDVKILADHYHYKIPFWSDFLYQLGIIEGTRPNCSHLMKKEQHILVFPGGAREAFKLKGEKYSLIWKHRTGFARMAIKHQCPIIPVSMVGAEECYDIIIDNHEIYSSPIGKLFKLIGYKQENILPIVKGLGPTIIPRPQKFYIKFGIPIDTTSLQSDYSNIQYCMDIYDTTKNEVQKGIDELLLIRSEDAPKSKISDKIKDDLLSYSVGQIVKLLIK